MNRHEDHTKEQTTPAVPAWGENMEGRIVLGLLDVSRTMRALYEGRGSQKRILIVLSETGTITQRELTARLGIQPGSASEVIAKLENAGLVERTASAEDRRTADIALTEEGLRQAQEALEQRKQRHAEMFSHLSGAEKEQLLALLEKLNRDWDERYPDARGRRHMHGHCGRPDQPHHPHPHGEAHGCGPDGAPCVHPGGRKTGRQE